VYFAYRDKKVRVFVIVFVRRFGRFSLALDINEQRYFAVRPTYHLAVHDRPPSTNPRSPVSSSTFVGTALRFVVTVRIGGKRSCFTIFSSLAYYV
jgi:hypothetical protein